MKRKPAPLPFLADRRLHGIRYCIKDGLRKLVPVRGLGAPPYTKYGVANSYHHEDYDENCEEFLVVSLSLGLPDKAGNYDCYITLQDGDDWMLQRWLPFTWENWCRQLDTYNAITQIDADVVELLAMEDFD